MRRRLQHGVAQSVAEAIVEGLAVVEIGMACQ
jgi:hypothetical protein